MSINPMYVPLFTLEEVMLDKSTGLPLSGGIVKFYEDAQRANPKPVFQISGVSPNYTFTNVGNTFVLGLNGTFVDINGNDFVPYAYPYDDDGNVDLYFVDVVNSGLVAQFTREAVPHLGDGGNPSQALQNTDNAISNPQFVEVSFYGDDPVVLNVTGTNTVTPLAPGWDIISSGTDTITIQLLQPTASYTPTNPPYAISIAAGSNLGSSVTLRQRFSNSPSFMRGEFASGSLTAAVLVGGSASINMVFAPSVGASQTIIPNTTIPSDGSYHIIDAVSAVIPQQANDPASTGYSDILISIQTSRTIAITSIQVVPVSAAVSVPFDEETAGRQIDHLFHYWKPKLEYKPIPSFLVGWDFYLNPAQFGSTVAAQAVGAGKSYYAWDQTILFQSVNSGITVARNADGSGSLSLTAAVDGQIAMIQYLEQSIARKILNQRMSVNFSGNFNTAGGLAGTISLYYTKDAALPDMNSNNSLVLTLDANGKPATFAAGKTWYEIPRLTTSAPAVAPNTTHGQDARFLVPNGSDASFSDVSISGWDMNASGDSLDATYFAIVVGFAPMTSTQQLAINSISLNSGDIPTRPAPQTPDEVLRECQYYLEYSYNKPTTTNPIGGNTQENEVTWISPAVIVTGAGGMDRPFKVSKRIKPTVAWYSPITPYAANTIYDTTNAATRPVTSNGAVGKNSTGYPNCSGNLAVNSFHIGHWTADARLGII